MSTEQENRIEQAWLKTDLAKEYKPFEMAVSSYWLEVIRSRDADLVKEIKNIEGWATIAGERYLKIEDIINLLQNK